MTTLALPQRREWSAVRVSVAGGMLGAIVLALVASFGMPGPVHFGADLYDELWLAVVSSELDVSARILRFEGHYMPDGTAYLYHGPAPLLTRALLAPFIEIGSVPLAGVSIWLWTVVGTASWHATALVAARAGLKVRGMETVPQAPVWAALLAAAVWLTSPALLLVSNHSLYHEPIAVAYGLAGTFAFLWSRATLQGSSLRPWLPVLAVLAALALFARPHVAVGLYVATCLAVVWTVWRERARSLLPAALAMALLGVGGLSYLGLNEARFGDAGVGHGSLARDTLQHGVIYWGREEPTSPRARGFNEQGRFNLRRVPTNAAFHLLAPPLMAGTLALRDRAETAHRAATIGHAGFVRIEPSGSGLAFLWTAWIVLAGASAWAARSLWRRQTGLLVGTGVIATFMLAYATITLRYTVDLWPLIATLAVLGIAAVAPRLSEPASADRWHRIAILSLGLSIAINFAVLGGYRYMFREQGDFFSRWSAAECRERAVAKGLPAERVDHVCRTPRVWQGS